MKNHISKTILSLIILAHSILLVMIFVNIVVEKQMELLHGTPLQQSVELLRLVVGLHLAQHYILMALEHML